MKWRIYALPLLVTDQAMAHSAAALPGGFKYGLIHPLTGFDHVLAMVAVGLWGAFLGAPLVYALPVVFPLLMVVGAVAGMLHVPLPPTELGIALSVLVLGLCIALAWRARSSIAVAIVALFALFHGHAHGIELPSATGPVGYAAGFVLATGLLHVAGISIGLLNIRPAGIVVTRCVGALIACAGIWFLGKASGLP
jgi:urease accessory protein